MHVHSCTYLSDYYLSLSIHSTLFTPGEFLTHFKNALHHLNTVRTILQCIVFSEFIAICVLYNIQLEQLSGDFLLPAIVFILIRAE